MMKRPSIYARWSFLAVGLMIFICGAILLRTLRPGGVRQIQTSISTELPSTEGSRLALASKRAALCRKRFQSSLMGSSSRSRAAISFPSEKDFATSASRTMPSPIFLIGGLGQRFSSSHIHKFCSNDE
jgi:hypothetical protein